MRGPLDRVCEGCPDDETQLQLTAVPSDRILHLIWQQCAQHMAFTPSAVLFQSAQQEQDRLGPGAVQVQFESACTALHYACKNGDLSSVKYIGWISQAEVSLFAPEIAPYLTVSSRTFWVCVSIGAGAHRQFVGAPFRVLMTESSKSVEQSVCHS